MLKWKYVFLSLSVLEFAIGFSHARPVVLVDLGLPLGAILFILFLISQLLEKESALYDEQNRTAVPVRTPSTPTQPTRPISRPTDNTNPAFSAAHLR